MPTPEASSSKLVEELRFLVRRQAQVTYKLIDIAFLRVTNKQDSLLPRALFEQKAKVSEHKQRIAN